MVVVDIVIIVVAPRQNQFVKRQKKVAFGPNKVLKL